MVVAICLACMLLDRIPNIGTFQFLSAHPLWKATTDTGPVGYFFKEANKILNPSDANFKGSDNKKLGCRNMAFYRGCADKKWNVPFSIPFAPVSKVLEFLVEWKVPIVLHTFLWDKLSWNTVAEVANA